MVKELPEYEYIRRADAMVALTNSETQVALKGMSGADAYNTVLQKLNSITAADVAPVRHGRWERVCTLRDETVFRCSNCNREVKVPYGLSKEQWAPYCHCGAKMDLEG